MPATEHLPSDGSRSLVSWRTQAGLTWDQIGELVGVSGETVRNWSTGLRCPRAQAQARLFAATGIPVTAWPRSDGGEAILDPDWINSLSNSGEEVRPIDGLPGYFISDIGRVFDTWTGVVRVVPQNTISDNRGYPTFQAKVDGKWARPRTHVVVATTFIGPRPSPEMEVCHANDVKTDNRALNLRWGTKSENRADAQRNGRVYGIGRPLEPAIAEQIRAAAASGASSRALARRFGVERLTVRRALGVARKAAA